MFSSSNSGIDFIIIVLSLCRLGKNNVIDVDDILSEDFMPGTLLMLENPKESLKNFNNSIVKADYFTNGDGSFNNAMSTMDFHRSMMNEYLCRNYVAEQIINDMTLSRIKRRMGTNPPGINTRSSKVPLSVKNELLQDEGSSNYKDWLSKSTTLEDIYRHYDNMNVQNRVEDQHGDDTDKDGGGNNEDYDEHVTGYTYQQQHQQHQGMTPSKLGHSGGGGGYMSGGGGGFPYSHGSSHSGGGSEYPYTGGHSSYGGGSGGGYGGGSPSGHGSHSGGYGGPPQTIPEHEHVVPDQPKFHIYHEESHSGKDHDLSDLFDIALTALAFFAFKLFIIHVVMCISMASNHATTTSMMMPMSMSPTSTGMMGMTGGGTGGGMTGTGMGMTSTGGENGGGTMPGTGGETGGGTMPGTGGETGGGTMPGTGGETGGGTMPGTGEGTGGDTGMGMNGETGGGSTGTGNGEPGDGGTDGETGEGGGTGEGTGTDDGDADNVRRILRRSILTGSTGTGTATGTGTGTGGTATGTATGTGTGMAAGASGTGVTTGRDTIKFRLRREVPTEGNSNTQRLNELARRILTSVEAAFVANEDDGNCLRQTLCENNKYSRSIEDNNKILIPVWREASRISRMFTSFRCEVLGMSWMSGRLAKNVNPATSMLDSLKASILGLGKANCEIIYQDCNLRHQQLERRKRRKKRDSVNKSSK